MSVSILNNVKKVLGIEDTYLAFDVDILMHINSAFSTLTQLGVGPPEGFEISDDTAVWDDFSVDPRMNLLKTYMYQKVRLLFDPPTTSFLLSAVQKQIEEAEWRMSSTREGDYWLPPETVIDGGNAPPE